jgi:Outer membrane receptor for ferrienterochelin and colicins
MDFLRICSHLNRSGRGGLLAGLLLTSSFLAIEPALADDDDTTWLDTIILVGTKTERSVKDNPRSVTVVTGKELERGTTGGIAELLRDVPGVEIADDSVAGMKRLRIRGESSRRVTILVDGQEITDHSTYGTPLLIDPATVERIEVVRGPSSVLYGAKAIGGVVNITTKGGAEKLFQVEAGGSYSSGSDGWQSWAAVSGSKNGFDYRLSGSLDKNGDRTVPEGRFSSTGELEDTSYSSDNLYGHIGYRFGERENHYLALKFEQHRLESEGWPGELSSSIEDFKIDLPKRDRRKIGLYYDGEDISDVIAKIHADIFYQTIDRLFVNDVTTSAGPGRRVAVKSTSDDTITDYGLNAQIDLDLIEGHRTIVGFQYLSDNLETDKTSNTTMTGFAPFPVTVNSSSFDKAHIDTYSVYAQDEWQLTDTVMLTAGARLYHSQIGLDETSVAARADFDDQRDTRLLSSLGATWKPAESTTLRASYSQGYITPTLLQMFSSTTAGGQGTTYGNPELDPEQSQNFEIGARYEEGGLALDAAAFYSMARDYIATTRCVAVTAYCLTTGTMSSPSSIYVNADKANTFGVELLAEYELQDSGLTPYVSGTWIRREVEYADFSTYNSDTPALSGRIGVRYDGLWQEHPIWADLFVRAATEDKQTYRSGADLVTETLPGWGTLNFAFGGNIGEDDKVSYAVRFNNILDKEYRPSFGELPGYGRSVEVSVRVAF